MGRFHRLAVRQLAVRQGLRAEERRREHRASRERHKIQSKPYQEDLLNETLFVVLRLFALLSKD